MRAYFSLLLPYIASIAGEMQIPRSCSRQIGRSMRQDPQDTSIFIDSYGKKYKRDKKGTMRKV